MSARVQASPAQNRRVVTFVAIVVFALVIGALGGSLATRSIVTGDGGTPAIGADTVKPGVSPGRVLVASPYANRNAIAWDAQKLEAMAGRVLYQPAPTIEGWDAQKLDAMKGRVLAG